jgi:hypothetical protein
MAEIRLVEWVNQTVLQDAFLGPSILPICVIDQTDAELGCDGAVDEETDVQPGGGRSRQVWVN